VPTGRFEPTGQRRLAQDVTLQSHFGVQSQPKTNKVAYLK